MPHFKSWRSYRDFERSVRRDLRYVRTRESEAFLQTVRSTSDKRNKGLKAGTILWRAQLGHDWRQEGVGEKAFAVPSAHPRERMKPFRDRASDGRANSRGIPCLYLSTLAATAVHEVRPWVGSYVSVGQFELNRAVRIVDFSGWRGLRRLYLREPPPARRQVAVWADIGRAFAEPMTRADDYADYAPTQIIAELFKSDGFDGIAYSSNFAEGANIALFDLDSADLINCQLHKVDSVEIKFSEQDNPYFVQKKAK